MKLFIALLGLISFTNAAEYRIISNFEGIGEDIGTLDDVNQKFGTNVTVDDAFANVTLGDFVACLEFPNLDLETKEVMGTGVDCIWRREGGSATIVFFNYDCGTMVHYGLASTGPFTAGIGIGPTFEDSPMPNTISGSLPAIGANTFLEGTGDFVGVTGNVRLSGALHLGDVIAFDCIWDIFIDLDSAPSCGLPATSTSSEIFTDTPDGVEKGRGVVQFLGLSEVVGELSDVNKDLSLDLTYEEAFGDLEGESRGCHKSELIDFITKEKLGDGIDCLWAIEGGIAAMAIFDFGDGNIIVNKGKTSVAPFTDGQGNGPVGGEGSPSAVVMSGSLPDSLDADTFVLGTGKYEGWRGNIRLSGALVPPVGENSYWFNCIWEITLVEIPEATTSSAQSLASGAAFFGLLALACSFLTM